MSSTLFYIGAASSLITWASHKQPIITHSTSEAEYITLAKTTKQAVWLHHLLYNLKKTELYKQKATPLYEDNQGALALADNLVFHPCMKHIHI